MKRRPRERPPDRSASRPFIEALAVNVRARRKLMRLTVHAASELAGVHWRHWQKVEAGEGNPTLETLARVANGLRVELPALLTAIEA